MAGRQPGDMGPSGDIEVRLPEKLQKMLSEGSPWVPLVGLCWGDPMLSTKEAVKVRGMGPHAPSWVFGALYGVDEHGICHVAPIFYPLGGLLAAEGAVLNDIPISAALEIVSFGAFNPQTGATVFYLPDECQWVRPAGGAPIVELP